MKEVIKAYYEAISKEDCSKEQIEQILQTLNKKDPQSKTILNGLIKELKKELEEMKTNFPDSLEFQKSLSDKIALCLEYNQEESKPEPIKIIFAKTTGGNTSFLSDLKHTKSDRYQDIWDMLQNFIQSDYKFHHQLEVFNISSIKPTSRGKQERIYGYVLPGGFAYIVGLAIKKDDWSKADKEFVENRIKSVTKDYEEVSELAINNALGERLDESQVIYEKIQEIIGIKEPEQKEEPIKQTTIESPVQPPVIETETKPVDQKSSWQTRLEELREFHKQNGHILILKGAKVNGYDYGSWLTLQRANYKKGLLSNDAIEALNELGMIWNVKEKEGRIRKQAILDSLGATSVKVVNGEQVYIMKDESQTDEPENLAPEDKVDYQTMPSLEDLTTEVEELREETDALIEENKQKEEYITNLEAILAEREYLQTLKRELLEEKETLDAKIRKLTPKIGNRN